MNTENAKYDPIIALTSSFGHGKVDILILKNLSDGVGVCLNWYILRGCFNEHLLMNIVSIYSPEYIECYRPFSKEELEWFNKTMHEHWNLLLDSLVEYKLLDKVPDIECPDYSVLETGDGIKEYIPPYYENNMREGAESFIAAYPDEVNEEYPERAIYGVTATLDKSDYYVSVYLNGALKKDGSINEDRHINRLSILEPKYLTCYRPFTKDELRWVNKVMHKEWLSIISDTDISIEDQPFIKCPDYSVLDEDGEVEPIEYEPSECYEDNQIEYEQWLVTDPTHPTLDITGTIRTINKDDYYVLVYLNKFSISLRPIGEDDPHINRISIIDPKYLTCYRPFTKEELEWVNKRMHENWNRVIDEIDRIYNYVYDLNVKVPDIQCPDFSVLETVD